MFSLFSSVNEYVPKILSESISWIIDFLIIEFQKMLLFIKYHVIDFVLKVNFQTKHF